MPDLTVQEKYPDSWRVDHANLGDVQKTTFARGVITEVRHSQDPPDEYGAIQPLVVESLVKVQIEGVGESDFIPLFYHPKPQYWDSEDGIKATDFNVEKGYFEKAWMSFRCGDEVNVMLFEGEPKAVLGFADGVPRIGEDIVKWKVLSETGYYQFSSESWDEYEGGENGPDDLSLKLLKRCTIYPIGNSGEIINPNKCVFFNGLTTAIGSNNGSSWQEIYDIWRWTKTVSIFYNFVAIIPIGPIIYRVAFLVYKWSTYLKIFGKYTLNEGDTGGEGWYNPPWHDPYLLQNLIHYEVEGETPPDGAAEIPWESIPNPHPEMVKAVSLEIKAMSCFPVMGSYYPDEIPISDPGPLPMIGHAASLGSVGSGGINPTTTTDAALSCEALTNPLLSDYKEVNESLENFYEQLMNLSFEDAEALLNDPDSVIEFYVRPHTREELQAAGMWPE